MTGTMQAQNSKDQTDESKSAAEVKKEKKPLPFTMMRTGDFAYPKPKKPSKSSKKTSDDKTKSKASFSAATVNSAGTSKSKYKSTVAATLPTLTPASAAVIPSTSSALTVSQRPSISAPPTSSSSNSSRQQQILPRESSPQNDSNHQQQQPRIQTSNFPRRYSPQQKCLQPSTSAAFAPTSLIASETRQEYETCCLVLWCDTLLNADDDEKESFCGEVLCTENVTCPQMHFIFDARTRYRGQSIALLDRKFFAPGRMLEIQTKFMPIGVNDPRHYLFLIETITDLNPIPHCKPQLQKVQVIHLPSDSNSSCYGRAIDERFYYARIPPFVWNRPFVKAAIQEGVESLIPPPDYAQHFQLYQLLEAYVIMCPKWVDELLSDAIYCRKLVLSIHSIPQFTEGIATIVEIQEPYFVVAKEELEYSKGNDSTANRILVPLYNSLYRIGQHISFQACASLRQSIYNCVALSHVPIHEQVDHLPTINPRIRTGHLISIEDEVDVQCPQQAIEQRPSLPQSLAGYFDSNYGNAQRVADLNLPSSKRALREFFKSRFLTAAEVAIEEELWSSGFSPPEVGSPVKNICEWVAPSEKFNYGDEIPCHLTVDPMEIARRENDKWIERNRRRIGRDEEGDYGWGEEEDELSDDERDAGWNDDDDGQQWIRREANLNALRNIEEEIANAQKEREATVGEREEQGKRKSRHTRVSQQRVRRILNHFGNMVNVSAFAPKRIDEPIPSEWQPNDIFRVIGLYDDVTMIFSSIIGSVQKEKQNEKKETVQTQALQRKYWLSRMSPRSTPTVYVTEFIRERDILKDCTQDSPSVSTIKQTIVIRNPLKQTKKDSSQTNVAALKANESSGIQTDIDVQ
ncbi:hypothetical protein WR25_02208 [Diploscapter pachys]|uniref:Uncharacterized protein n=1 Tax=Diploscapter pachys TaxID=2018661 RepID=A0A2A2J936_9BILA|nr:hypothetical protein WR25_02208 [Diploscapter pachys]